jgi:hypothetical protein
VARGRANPLRRSAGWTDHDPIVTNRLHRCNG